MGLEPVVYKNFIDEQERMALLEHALSQKLYNNPIAAPLGTRTCKRIDGTDSYTSLVDTIFKRIVDRLQLTNPVVDPLLGQIISVIKPGGFVHLHRDLYKKIDYKNNHNLRFNIMVDRGDDICYNPIIEDVVYEVNKCDAWCFAASKFAHKTIPIVGPEFRVVYQFGFLV